MSSSQHTTATFHRDRGMVLLPPKPQLTPEGFLRTYMRIAKAGELKYRNTDGSERIEVVSPEVLFSKDSMDSFKMKSITYPHPPVRVNSVNSMQYQRGMLGHYAIIDGDFLGFVGTVTDKSAVDALLSGEAREASSGYGAPIRLREDSKYDQLARLGNHVAIVPAGRAGTEVRFHVDGDEESCWYQADAIDGYSVESEALQEVFKDIQPIQIWDLANRSSSLSEGELTEEHLPKSIAQTHEPKKSDAKEPKKMRQITIGGEIFTVEDDNLANAILKLIAAQEEDEEEDELPAPIRSMGYMDATDAAIGLKAKLDEAEGKAIGLQSRIDALEAQPEQPQTRMDADEIASAITMRMDTWEKVLPLLRQDAADFQPDYKLDVAEIQKLAIAKQQPNLNLDGKSAEFIQGVWAGIEPGLTQASQRQDSSIDLHDRVQQAQRQDAGEMPMGKSSVASKRKARSMAPVK